MSIDGEVVATTPVFGSSPLFERAAQNVVVVGGDDQLVDRQAHALGGIAGEDVAEIAGRHGEGHRPVGGAERDGGGEIIDDLGHDAGPVDRVHARQLNTHRGSVVVEHVLHQALAVVEVAFDRERMDVGVVAPWSSGAAAPARRGHAETG
jgi:hypothetical protein